MKESPAFPTTPAAARQLEAARGPIDLLREVLRTPGVVAEALEAIGVDQEALHRRVEALPAPAGDCQGILRGAHREAILLGHTRVDSVHLLLAMLYTDSPDTARVLAEGGVTLYDVRTYLQSGEARQRTARLRSRPAPSVSGIRVSPVFLIPLAVMLGSGAALALGAPGPLVTPLTILFVVGGWVVSLCLHEFGHALAAYIGGDHGVAAAGYLSLNPLRYANILFSIVLPVVFVLLGGIGLPGGAVYVDPRALRSAAWSALVAAAGPLGTLLFTLVVALPFLLGLTHALALPVALWAALAFLIVIEIGALILNLLPIPPLDGFGIVAAGLSWEARAAISRIGNFGILIIFLLLWQGPVASVFWGVVYTIAGWLGVPEVLAAIGHNQMIFW